MQPWRLIGKVDIATGTYCIPPPTAVLLVMDSRADVLEHAWGKLDRKREDSGIARVRAMTEVHRINYEGI